VKTLANALIGNDGVITSRTKGLKDSIARNTHQQEQLEKRVQLMQDRLTKQYGALDVSLSKINAQNSSLSQALKALAAQTEGIARNS
jgi:flagellar hook-associated protein 2